MNDLEFRLLNEFQRDFPLCSEPFGAVAERLGAGAEAVLAAYSRLQAHGALSRIGAVFSPNRVGASTLAAMRVPEERLAEVAERVSACPEVNHNYEREHEFNMWFVLATETPEGIEAAVAKIERASGYRVLNLPKLREYFVNLRLTV